VLPAPPTVSVTVAPVGLPFERATIKWKASAKEPTEIRAFWQAVETLTADLRFTDVPNSTCGRHAVDALDIALRQTAAQPACSAPDATVITCRARFDLSLRDATKQVLADAECTDASGDDLDGVKAVDAKVREFVTASMTTAADAELTFKNRPLTHWALGAGSGVLTAARLSLPRVTLGDALIKADPMPRVVTTAFVNWSPAGYDAELDTISGAERVRPFFGATLTPDFGVTAGINVILAHGIGITAGGVVMFAKGALLEEIGKTPANPDKPYALSYARGFVLGISYNFQ
jgi:hypothetical protein